MGSSSGQQNQKAPGGKGAPLSQSSPGGKGAGQPQQSPGMKGGAGQPMQSPPGGKGAGHPQQPMPGGKGIPSGQPTLMPSGQPTPGMKGGPANGLQPMPGQQGQMPGGKGGMSMMQGGDDIYHSNGGSSMQPQQPMPGGKGAAPMGQSDLQRAQQGQPMPGGKGAGQMDPRMMQMTLQSGNPQPQQPFHSATTNNYNAPPAARANSPYGPPGTNGNPAAFGMQPGQTGFGFGNGGARVPDTQPMIAGQQKPMQGLGQLGMPMSQAQRMMG